MLNAVLGSCSFRRFRRAYRFWRPPSSELTLEVYPIICPNRRRTPRTRRGFPGLRCRDRLSVIAPETLNFFPYEGLSSSTSIRMPINAPVSSAENSLAVESLGIYAQNSCRVSSISTPIIGNIRTYIYKTHCFSLLRYTTIP